MTPDPIRRPVQTVIDYTARALRVGNLWSFAKTLTIPAGASSGIALRANALSARFRIGATAPIHFELLEDVDCDATASAAGHRLNRRIGDDGAHDIIDPDPPAPTGGIMMYQDVGQRIEMPHFAVLASDGWYFARLTNLGDAEVKACLGIDYSAS